MEVNLTGYSLPPPTDPSLFKLAKIADGMSSINGDVRDLDHLKSVIQKETPEIIIHMAAQSLVVKSYNDPHETYTTNVLGTLNVLEAIRHSDSVKVVTVITSDKCYQNQEWIWGYRESDILGGNDPYSNSKACAELISRTYREAYFGPSNPNWQGAAIATVRAGNVIGGGDWAKNRLIPDIIKAIDTNSKLLIRNPDSTRPWQHVLEPLNGYMSLIERLWINKEKYATEWNFGPNENEMRSVSWVVDRLTEIWDKNITWESHPKTYPHEANYLRLDSSKARQELKWQPKLNLETTLNWVAEWYKKSATENIEKLTNRQIIQYQNLNII